MKLLKKIQRRRKNRAHRIRNRVRGTAASPRISVHRTNMNIYAQMIDDENGRTLCSVSSVSLKIPYGGNVSAAKQVGEELGRQAKELNVERAGFDRGCNR